MEKRNTQLEEMLIALQSSLKEKDFEILKLRSAPRAAAPAATSTAVSSSTGTAGLGISTDTQSNTSIFDIENILRLTEVDNKYKDIVFELEKLKLDNS